MTVVKILLVDDHAIVREGLRALLESQPRLRVIGEAADGEQAVAQAVALSPDVVMLDISMPKMNGIEAARHIRRLKPKARIIMISINDDAGHVADSFKSGARGYVVKDTAPEEICLAVEKVHEGGIYCSEQALPGGESGALESLVADGAGDA